MHHAVAPYLGLCDPNVDDHGCARQWQHRGAVEDPFEVQVEALQLLLAARPLGPELLLVLLLLGRMLLRGWACGGRRAGAGRRVGEAGAAGGWE
jgi:hypothetical protein